MFYQLISIILALTCLSAVPARADSLDDNLRQLELNNKATLTSYSRSDLRGVKRVAWLARHLSDNSVKIIQTSLKQLDVPVEQYNFQLSVPNDVAILDISLEREIHSCTHVDLNVSQQICLARDPSHPYLGNTYVDKAVLGDGGEVQAVQDLMSRFVVNFLRRDR